MWWILHALFRRYVMTPCLVNHSFLPEYFSLVVRLFNIYFRIKCDALSTSDPTLTAAVVTSKDSVPLGKHKPPACEHDPVCQVPSEKVMTLAAALGDKKHLCLNPLTPHPPQKKNLSGGWTKETQREACRTGVGDGTARHGKPSGEDASC